MKISKRALFSDYNTETAGKQPLSGKSVEGNGKIFPAAPFTKPEKPAIIFRLSSKCTGGSMDRASDSGSEGWGFESLPVYHEKTVVLIETTVFSA